MDEYYHSAAIVKFMVPILTFKAIASLFAAQFTFYYRIDAFVSAATKVYENCSSHLCYTVFKSFNGQVFVHLAGCLFLSQILSLYVVICLLMLLSSLNLNGQQVPPCCEPIITIN